MATDKLTGEDAKRAAIHDAAIGEFSARGFSNTSMANIADAVGMSRPALYQYFQNKGDIFASAFTALIDDAVDRSLAALEAPGTVAEQLDGFLQRFDGDLWERTSASPHSDEILNAKSAHAAEGVAIAYARHRAGLAGYLRQVGPGGRARAVEEQRTAWADLLALSPKGFKSDDPAVDRYRRRLFTLAHSVAADIEASSGPSA